VHLGGIRGALLRQDGGPHAHSHPIGAGKCCVIVLAFDFIVIDAISFVVLHRAFVCDLVFKVRFSSVERNYHSNDVS
jgi:hypothetical protein